MNFFEHIIFSFAILAAILILFGSYIPIDINTASFFFGFFIFTVFVTPDIDKKLPLIKHRGITHYPLTPVLLSGLLVLGVYYIIPQYLTPVLFFSAGIIVSWWLHLIADYLHFRFKWLVWIMIVIMFVIVYMLKGQNMIVGA